MTQQSNKTLEIPQEVLQPTENPASGQSQQKSVTEQLQEIQLDLSKFRWIALVNTDTFKYLDITLRNEIDFSKGNWHFIPHTVNPEFRHEHDGKKVCIEIYCIDDKSCMRRLKKIINRYFPGRKFQWELFEPQA